MRKHFAGGRDYPGSRGSGRQSPAFWGSKIRVGWRKSGIRATKKLHNLSQRCIIENIELRIHEERLEMIFFENEKKLLQEDAPAEHTNHIRFQKRN